MSIFPSDAQSHISRHKSVMPLPTSPFRKRPQENNKLPLDRKNMTTVRRMPDADVRAIFECLHNNRPPPPHLKFQIVPAVPNGLVLSPPPFEFEDGYYVLLKPRKKTEKVDLSKVPPHLTHLIMRQLPPENCPWSLSGPQFPKPTAIQQRYCYPTGRAEYSGKKGGALWTMHGADGKEDVQFRLLHVYFSAKRAVNKGFSKSGNHGTVSDDSYSPPARKRAKRTRNTGSHLRTPHRKTRATKAAAAVATAGPPNTPHLASPAITNSTAGSASLCASPGSVGTLPPATYTFSCTNSPASHHSGIDNMNRMLENHPMPPINSTSYLSFCDTEFDDGLSCRPFYPVGHFELQQSQGGEPFSSGRPLIHPGMNTFTSIFATSNHSKFANGNSNSNVNGAAASRERQQHHHMHDHDMMDMEAGFGWNDSIMSISTKPSYDYLDSPSRHPNTTLTTSPGVNDFASHLDVLHRRLRDMIQTAPSGEQGALVSTFASWANHVAKEPMGSTSSNANATTGSNGGSGPAAATATAATAAGTKKSPLKNNPFRKN